MKQHKTQSLDEFVKEIQKDISEFAKAYHKKHEENPEHYPLELPVNDNLWYEFFMGYCKYCQCNHFKEATDPELAKKLKTCSACGREHEGEKCPNGCQDTNRSGILII